MSRIKYCPAEIAERAEMLCAAKSSHTEITDITEILFSFGKGVGGREVFHLFYYYDS